MVKENIDAFIEPWRFMGNEGVSYVTFESF